MVRVSSDMVIQKGKVPPLEKAEEAEFLKFLKQLPVRTRKMNGLGSAAYPDRLVIGPAGFTMWVEMKRKKIGKLSPGQEELFAELSTMGHKVHIFDDGKEAAEAVKQQLIKYGVL